MDRGWTFLATRWDGTVLDEIPFSSFTFAKPLKAVGSWSATAPIKPTTGYNPVSANNLDPGRTLIFALDPGGTPRWGGPLWRTSTAVTGDDEGVVELSGTDMGGYLQRRILETQLDYSGAGIKPGALVAAALYVVAIFVGFDIPNYTGVIDSASGDLIYPNLLVEEFHTLHDIIKLSADRVNGFEWAWNVTGSQETGLGFEFVFQPAIGRALDLDFDTNRNIVVTSYVCDASEMANEIWIAGSGSGASKVTGTHEDTASRPTYPFLQASESSKTGSLTSGDLDAEAEALVDSRKVCARYASVEVYDVGDQPVVGTFEPGDTVRLKIDDGFAQEDDTFRITSVNVEINEDGKETVTANLLSDNVASELVRRQPDIVRLMREALHGVKSLENA